MKRFIFIILFCCLTKNLSGFDLCPACSPETVASETGLPGYMLGKNRFSFIGLYRFGGVHTGQHEHSDFERALVSFNYGVTDKFKAGLMYGFSSNKLSLQIDYLILQEKDIKPSLVLGTGSFRGIFSESHPYLISMKNLEQHIKLPIKISFGIKHKGDDISKIRLEPAGNLIFRIYQSVHIMAIFEGEEFDIAMYGILFDKFIFGLRMIELKSPAVGIVLRI